MVIPPPIVKSNTSVTRPLRRWARWWIWLVVGLVVAFIVCWVIGADFGRTPYGRWTVVENPLLQGELLPTPQVSDDSAEGSIYLPTAGNTIINRIESLRMDDGKELLTIFYRYPGLGEYELRPYRLFLTVFDPRTKQFQDLSTQPSLLYGAGVLLLPDYRLVQVASGRVLVVNLKTNTVRQSCMLGASGFASLSCRDERGQYIERQYEEQDSGEESPVGGSFSIGDYPLVLPLPDDRILIHGSGSAPANKNEYIFNLGTGEFSQLDQLIDGLPTFPSQFDDLRLLQLDDYRTLIRQKNQLTLFDGRQQRVVWQVDLPRETDGGSAVACQQVGKNLILVSPRIVSFQSPMYLINIKTGQIFARQVGSDLLAQSWLNSSANGADSDLVKRGSYVVSVARSNQLLITSSDYEGLPAEFGLFELPAARRLKPHYYAGVPSSQENYADKYQLSEQMVQGVQEAVTLSDGSVLLAGPLWVMYESPRWGFCARLVNWLFGPRLSRLPTTDFVHRGVWREQTISAKDDSQMVALAGTYALPNGKVLFVQPGKKVTAGSGGANWQGTGEFGYLYDPGNGQTQKVSSSLLKGKSFPYNDGLVFPNGEVHFIRSGDEPEALIYRSRANSFVLTKIKYSGRSDNPSRMRLGKQRVVDGNKAYLWGAVATTSQAPSPSGAKQAAAELVIYDAARRTLSNPYYEMEFELEQSKSTPQVSNQRLKDFQATLPPAAEAAVRIGEQRALLMVDGKLVMYDFDRRAKTTIGQSTIVEDYQIISMDRRLAILTGADEKGRTIVELANLSARRITNLTPLGLPVRSTTRAFYLAPDQLYFARKVDSLDAIFHLPSRTLFWAAQPATSDHYLPLAGGRLLSYRLEDGKLISPASVYYPKQPLNFWQLLFWWQLGQLLVGGIILWLCRLRASRVLLKRGNVTSV